MEPLLQLDEITHYYGRVCALTEVSLSIPPGAIGLVGQNGAGKSTMMQILLGLIRPSSGRGRVLGMDIATAGIELRGRVGYMPERDVQVPGLNGHEFVSLAGELCGMPRRDALRRAHESLSYVGLEESRYRKLEQYSLGMKQRLKLAATLVHDPDVLLLDEPTAGLDADGRAEMLDLLAELSENANRSLVLSSHLLGDIEQICHSTIILDAGRVIGIGPIEDLKDARPRTYRLQFKGEPAAFLDELSKSGPIIHEQTPHEARIEVAQDWSNRDFFRAAARHGLTLTGVEPEVEDFAEIYHRLVTSAAPKPAKAKVVSEAAR